MNREVSSARLSRFRRIMKEEGVDAFLVAVPENRYYLSGFEAEDLHPTESSGYLMIAESRQFLLTDFRYQESARQEAPDFELLIYSNGLVQTLSDLFAEIRPQRLGLERDYITYRKYQEVLEALEATETKGETVLTDGLVEKLRVIKEPAEIESIKHSLALTENALVEVWNALSPGKTEKQVAWEIERRIREGGGEAVSFPPIVAAGPNAALPHAVPSRREIAPGETVILDLGSKLNHYCSDMTRTWFYGRLDKKLREIYRIVREAQLAAQEAIRAGKDTVEIDKLARDIIQREGYGEYFGHGLGHGVGLAVHEKPGLRKLNPTILEENMVVTVEPGIYLPGIGGVRLENMVRVTGTGCEILNRQDLFYEW